MFYFLQVKSMPTDEAFSFDYKVSMGIFSHKKYGSR